MHADTNGGRSRKLISAVVVVVLVAALATVVWFWRHPTAFREAGGWGVGHENLALDTAMFVGMSYEDPEARGIVTIDSAAARVVSDSAGTRVDFFVCTIDESASIGGIGAEDRAHVDKFCASLVPAAGARLELNAEPRQQLLMAVTLTKAGRVEIDGLDLSYRHGWQHGTQHIGGEVEVRHPQP